VKTGRWLAGEEGPDGGAMAGVNWNHRNGAPRRETGNGRYREGRELTVSRMGAFSAFGTGSRRDVDGGGALRLRERTAELRVASVTSFEARVWENRGGGGSRLRAENGDRGGALLGVI